VQQPVAVFARYKQAALDDDGSTIAALLSQGSVDHYGRLQKAALSSQDPKLDTSLRLVDQIQVNILRRAISADQLRAMSAVDVVVFAFEHHMMGEDLEVSSRLDQVAISETVAFGRHIARDRPVGQGFREVTFRMLREEGNWRLDLMHSLDVMEGQLHDVAALSDKTAQEYADQIPEFFVGKTLAEAVAANHGAIEHAPLPPPITQLTPATRGEGG
jgi:hypothetical protein